MACGCGAAAAAGVVCRAAVIGGGAKLSPNERHDDNYGAMRYVSQTGNPAWGVTAMIAHSHMQHTNIPWQTDSQQAARWLAVIANASAPANLVGSTICAIAN